jgi:hypothetical protein
VVNPLEETNQTNTKKISAKSIVKGEILLDKLPKPYVIIADSGEFENLSKATNILAIKQNYRIVSFAATDVDDGINYGYVIMEKNEKGKGKEGNDSTTRL